MQIYRAHRALYSLQPTGHSSKITLASVAQMHITTLVRPIDPRYPSNIAVLIIATIVAITTMAAGQEISGSVAFASFIGAFLTWAIGRELDPDHSISALLAAGFSAPIMIWLGPPDLLLMTAVLMLARILIRSSGLPPTVLDLVAVSLLGAALGLREGGWLLALGLAFGVVRDRSLPGSPPRFARIAGWVIAAAATGLAVRSGVGVMTSPTAFQIGFVSVGIVAGLAGRLYEPASTGDITNQPLLRRRLASSRRIVATTALASIASSGTQAIAGTAPLWAVYVAILLVSSGAVPSSGPEGLSS